MGRRVVCKSVKDDLVEITCDLCEGQSYPEMECINLNKNSSYVHLSLGSGFQPQEKVSSS